LLHPLNWHLPAAFAHIRYRTFSLMLEMFDIFTPSILVYNCFLILHLPVSIVVGGEILEHNSVFGFPEAIRHFLSSPFY